MGLVNITREVTLFSMHEDLEGQIISSCLQGADLTEFVSLASDCWTSELNQNIHRIVSRLFLEGKAVDQLSVYHELQSSTTPLKFDHMMKLSSEYVLVDATFGKMCERLRESTQQRRVVQAVSEAVVLAQEASSAYEARQTAIGRLLDMDDMTPDKRLFPAKESLQSVIKLAQVAFERPTAEKDKPPGISSGIRGLDRILGGFRDGGLYVLGAGTGRGKSVLGVNIGFDAAKSGHKVMYCSLEMSHVDLMRRIISSESGISGDLIESGHLTEQQIDSLQYSAGSIYSTSANMIILDQPSLTLYQLGASVRQQVKSGNCDMVIVDYLQLLRTDSTYSREREVAEISSSLVAIARTNNVPVIALSQLNDTGQIRESRAVEHDATGILKIQYPEHVESDWSDGEEVVEGSIVVQKHRHGRTGRVNVMFDRPKQRFYEVVSNY